jgi:hypothetical protein
MKDIDKNELVQKIKTMEKNNTIYELIKEYC